MVARNEEQRHRYNEAKRDRRLADPEYVEKIRAKARARYRDDQEYREGVNAASKKRYDQDRAAGIKRAHEWREAHKNDPKFKEKRRKRISAWRKANPEKIASYADPERDRIRSAEYRAANPGKRKLVCSKYRKANKVELAAYNSAYAKANPQKTIISRHNRRARIKANGGKLSPTIIDTLFAEQGGKCSYCFVDLNESGHHLDHVIPISRKGRNDDSNVQLLCPPCNHRKSASHPLDFMRENGIFPSPLISAIAPTQG